MSGDFCQKIGIAQEGKGRFQIRSYSIISPMLTILNQDFNIRFNVTTQVCIKTSKRCYYNSINHKCIKKKP